MKNISALIGLLLFCIMPALAQTFKQYFDGKDTNANNSLIVRFDTLSPNVWQIGKPVKNFFDSAATQPNAIVTDTQNTYPMGDTSWFEFTIKELQPWGILAVQWVQKLDMDTGKDGGLVEFSADNGSTWQNAFDNPYVYNFYGFDSANVDTLPSGEMAFTGTDSAWKSIWLCYDLSWVGFNDSILVRYRLVSDSVDQNREGWILDNFMVRMTLIHTVDMDEQEEYMLITPNPGKGRIEISSKKRDQYHIIEGIELRDLQGKKVRTWGPRPTKTFIDVSGVPAGPYILKVKTNIKSKSFRIVLEE